MPRIMVVENSGSIERPARLAHLCRGIRPAVPDDLIGANQEMQIHFSLYIEWCCPKRRRVKPGKRLGRSYVVAEKMVGRSSSTQGGESPPVWSLALRQRDQ